MLFSTERKQILCGWLLENNRDTFMNSPLKVQKFLFMYECMSKVSGYEYELNEELARRANFIVNSVTDNEISDITHMFDIWKSKEDINSGINHVELYESDVNLMKSIMDLYPLSLVDSHKIINKDPKYFIISKDDYSKLNTELLKAIDILAGKDDLINPVFLEISESGGLLVD